jgi:hypothetical protein
VHRSLGHAGHVHSLWADSNRIGNVQHKLCVEGFSVYCVTDE